MSIFHKIMETLGDARLSLFMSGVMFSNAITDAISGRWGVFCFSAFLFWLNIRAWKLLREVPACRVVDCEGSGDND